MCSMLQIQLQAREVCGALFNCKHVSISWTLLDSRHSLVVELVRMPMTRDTVLANMMGMVP
jgi:hypothetical protein